VIFLAWFAIGSAFSKWGSKIARNLPSMEKGKPFLNCYAFVKEDKETFHMARQVTGMLLKLQIPSRVNNPHSNIFVQKL